MRKQWIRIYEPLGDPDKHSFYVGYVRGGISERLASFDIEKTTTFSDLRQMLCWREQNGFLKRTIIYTELLEAMRSSTNKYNYPKGDLREFRFGIRVSDRDESKAEGDACSKDSLPKIIQRDIEDEPIDQIIAQDLDLILVPLVLIPK